MTESLPDADEASRAVPIQPAATVLIIRDAVVDNAVGVGIETLLLERRAASVFVPGVHVFPGGRVDAQDYRVVEQGLTTGWPGDDPFETGPAHQPRSSPEDRDGTDASDIDGGLPLDLAFWVAAVRETFEETGLLLAQPTGDLNGLGPALAERAAVDAGDRTMTEVCLDHGLRLDTASMVYFGHWTTPVGPPRRYDTQFFVARCPRDQSVEPDGVEAIDAIWRTPTAAVQATLDHEIDLIVPTYRALVALTRFASTEEVLAALWPHGPKSGRMVSDEGGGFRVSLPPWEPTDREEDEGDEPFPRIPPEIRARRGTND